MRLPRVLLVVAGRAGSGKTTLLERLLPRLCAAGLRVAAVKRTHHDVDLDPPGKDSRRLRDAGAAPVALAGPVRTTVFLPTPRGDGTARLVRLLASRARLDLVLVEGGASLPRWKRIEVVPPGGRVTTRPASLLLAVASDGERAPRGVPLHPRDDVAGLAARVLAWAGRRVTPASGGRPSRGPASRARPSARASAGGTRGRRRSGGASGRAPPRRAR